MFYAKSRETLSPRFRPKILIRLLFEAVSFGEDHFFIRLIDRQFGDLLIERQVVSRDLCIGVLASAAVTDDLGS
tara:strand:+ start:1910 stop:2131 length:222 start_codon:yes stop_codon:yes gene_type:complete